MKRTRKICSIGVLCLTLLTTSVSLADKAALERAKAQKSAAKAAYEKAATELADKAEKSRAASVKVSEAQLTNGRIELLLNAKDGKNAVPAAPPKTSTDSNVVCKHQPFRLDFTTVGSFLALNNQSNSSKFFAGAILTRQSVVNGNYQPVLDLPRRKPFPLTMTMLELPENRNARTVTVTLPVTLDNVQSAKGRLLTQFGNATIPTSGDVNVASFVAGAELAASLQSTSGGNIPLQEFEIPAEVSFEENIGVKAAAKLNVERYTVKLFEPMYTINVGNINTPEDWFEEPDAFKGIDGVMIDSVTFGRLLLLNIEGVGGVQSLEALLSEKAGVTATLEGVTVGLERKVEASASEKTSFQIKRMKATIIGGDSVEGHALEASLLTGDDAVKKLSAYINARSASRLSAATAALPIAYSMIDVRTGAGMGVRATTDADVLSECRAARKLRVELVSLKATRVVDNVAGVGGDNEDLYGEISVNIDSARLLGGRDNQKLFDFNESAPLRLKQGEVAGRKALGGGTIFEATIHPDDLEKFVVKFSESVRDDFDDGEQAFNGGRRFGSYEFAGSSNRFDATNLDLLNKGGSVDRTLKLQESNAEPTLEARIRFSLVE